MGPVGLGVAAVAISATAAGYGIYANERAQKAAQQQAQKAAADQQKFQQQQADQLAQQQKQAQALADQQAAQQAQNLADIKAQQAAAIQQEQAAIPGIQDQINQSLMKQNAQAAQVYEPTLEARLNALGLLQSGALPAQQAYYQSQLDSQRQAALANYAISAQQQITGQQAANVGTDVGLQQQNLMSQLGTQQQNMVQGWQNQAVANQNNLAYQQYVAQLQAAQTQAQQQAAGGYLNFGATLGSGLLNYYGNQSRSNAPSGGGSGLMGGGYNYYNPYGGGTGFNPYGGVYSNPYSKTSY